MSIDILNEDCLEMVFRMLSLPDKCAAARVRTRWHEIILSVVENEGVVIIVYIRGVFVFANQARDYGVITDQSDKETPDLIDFVTVLLSEGLNGNYAIGRFEGFAANRLEFLTVNFIILTNVRIRTEEVWYLLSFLPNLTILHLRNVYTIVGVSINNLVWFNMHILTPHMQSIAACRVCYPRFNWVAYANGCNVPLEILD